MVYDHARRWFPELVGDALRLRCVAGARPRDVPTLVRTTGRRGPLLLVERDVRRAEAHPVAAVGRCLVRRAEAGAVRSMAGGLPPRLHLAGRRPQRRVSPSRVRTPRARRPRRRALRRHRAVRSGAVVRAGRPVLLAVDPRSASSTPWSAPGSARRRCGASSPTARCCTRRSAPGSNGSSGSPPMP